jgi:hypothetical protein
MVAVKGIYQGGDTIKLDAFSVPIHEPYEVIVSFINPLKPKESNQTTEAINKRDKAFQNFMQYRGTLPADFDYRKELAEYRDERHGNFN